MAKKIKVVMSNQVKKQLETLPKGVKKSFDKKIEQLKKNPYLGEPVDPMEMKCILIEQFYNLEPFEVLSLVTSNQEWVEDDSKVGLLMKEHWKINI